MLHVFSLIFILLASLSGVLAASNRTIDDEFGDTVTGFQPVYQPVSAWNFGPDCSACNLGPGSFNESNILNGTWHDATAKEPTDVFNVTLNFTGTAIYVFCIVPNTVPNTATTVDLSFSLDGTYTRSYIHRPDATNTTLYNVPVFSSAGLQNTSHTLVVSLDNAGENSLMLFDYAIYTIDDETVQPPAPTPAIPYPHPTSPGTPLGAILGGALAGTALVLLAVIFFMRRRQHRLRSAKLDMAERAGPPGGNAHAQAPPGALQDGAASHAGAYNTPAPYYDRTAYDAYAAPPPNDEPAGPPGPVVRGVASGKVIADVRRPLVSGDGQYPRASTSVTGWPDVVPPSEADSASDAGRSTVLVQQVESLQAEVERLRSAVYQRQGAPPAYG